MDVDNRVIGWRLSHGDSSPKYLKFKEKSKLFDKAVIFTDWNFAKFKKKIILCEGYVDVVPCIKQDLQMQLALGAYLHFTSSHGTCAIDIQRMSFCHLTVMRRGGERYCRRCRSQKKQDLRFVSPVYSSYKGSHDEFIKGLGAQALEEQIRKAVGSFVFPGK